MSADFSPTTLGPYRLTGELGRGAWAVVWRAWDPKLEREVAIKEPLRRPEDDAHRAAAARERFVGEGRIAAQLYHPGIVMIHAADVFEGNRPAIVMELVHGHTLADDLHAGPLPVATVLTISKHLLDALEYAHSRGVVHRDIKPENVFVTNDGRVKLADFGIAHGPSSSLADAGMVLGTPGYMAPEQVHGLTADARADVFAMGALMYEMLAGRNPFGAGTSDDVSTIMYRTTEADVAPVGDIRPEVPRRLSNLVAKAMARDQGARWRSSEVMAAELARIKPPSGVAGALSAEQHELRQQAGVVSSVVANQASTVQEHLPQKDSTVWIVLGAGAFVVLLLAMIFLLGGSETSGIAVFGLIIAGIGTGVYFMVRSNRRAQPAELEDVFAKVRESEARQVSGHTPDGTLTLSIETRGVRSVHRVSLPLVIGRSSDADLVLADNQMSRRHARLSQRAEDGVVWVEDLGSRNGTWIGTHRADGPSVVPRGAPLRIGDSIFVVES